VEEDGGLAAMNEAETKSRKRTVSGRENNTLIFYSFFFKNNNNTVQAIS